MRRKYVRKTHGVSEEVSINIGNYHRSTEIWAHALADLEGNPNIVPHALRRLSQLLSDSALRAELGSSVMVPYLWQNGKAASTGGGIESEPVAREEGEVHEDSSLRETPVKRTMSVHARALISEAQRQRWARQKAEKEKTPNRKWGQVAETIKDSVVKMRAEGMIRSQIAKKLNVSKSTVDRAIVLARKAEASEKGESA